MTRLMPTLVVLMMAAWSGAVPAEAQSLSTPPSPPAHEANGSSEPNPLPGLPRPADQPASLYQPAPAGPLYGCPELERPYFECDPLLDPPCLPQPGWLFDVQIGALGSSVVESVGHFAPGATVPAVAGTNYASVAVPMAPLDWTVSPRFELGYRLPSGFGEVDVSYRFLSTQGTAATLDATGAPATLTSHLSMNVIDLDYASRETSLGPCWDMKWRFGLRYADIYFDSQMTGTVVDPFNNPNPTPPPALITYQSPTITDNAWGVGPHAGVELKKRALLDNPWGLEFVARLDGGVVFGEVTQRVTAISGNAPGATVFPWELNCPEQMAMVGGFLGLDWHPPRYHNLGLLVGYSGEYWWNVGRLADPDVYNGQSAGEVGTQGPVFRLECNY